MEAIVFCPQDLTHGVKTIDVDDRSEFERKTRQHLYTKFPQTYNISFVYDCEDEYARIWITEENSVVELFVAKLVYPF